MEKLYVLNVLKSLKERLIQDTVEYFRDANLGKFLMWLAIIVLAIGALSGGCSYINQKLGLPDDNLIEEAIESKIEDATGLDIDLTPDSEEDR